MLLLIFFYYHIYSAMPLSCDDNRFFHYLCNTFIECPIMYKRKSLFRILLGICTAAVLCACSSTKHVPEGAFLLNKVDIRVSDNEDIKGSSLNKYLKQTPNHSVLGGLKMQLGIYNMSGRDSTKAVNKWLRRMGEAPVLYNHAMTEASKKELKTMLTNKGYMSARVTADTTINTKKRKIDITYNVTTGTPHYIGSVTYNIPNDSLRELILADTASSKLKPNIPFDRNILSQQRDEITRMLREKGYYAFNKEYITFTADTTEGSNMVDLTLNTMPPYANDRMKYYTSHKPFFVRNVTFVTNYDPLTMHDANGYIAQDTTHYKGYTILYGEYRYINSKTLEECCFINPGELYKSSDITKTYQALGRLGILKFINIDVVPLGEIDGKIWLDTYILLTPGKSQSITFSLEGTNSEGDLGFGIGAGYQHRNIAGGSELLNTKFKASYESLSGDLNGLINKNYSEYSGEVGITFPKFKAPFLKKEFKQKILASTELATQFNYQARPEYTRIIAGAAYKYIWSEKRRNTRHTFTLLDINYVYLPESRINFLDSIQNPLLRYSYEDHFIMRLGYSFYHSNKKERDLLNSPFQENVYTIRAGAETAGNVLYGISNAVGANKKNGEYEIFGIRYSQYAKLDFDYSLTRNFSTRSSLSFRVGAGVGVPYGNSNVLPFEKRFYAGGANSVRGWGVRTLGPGSYDGKNSVNNFIYQCGDIRLDLNLEYRAKLFWVVELGAFIDAGNIWTIREYEDQPGGAFKIDQFYKQIALSYGLGLRLDFSYFLLRFDVGMKAHNPAQGQEEWPLLQPNWNRDAAFHFSVGYPF